MCFKKGVKQIKRKDFFNNLIQRCRRLFDYLPGNAVRFRAQIDDLCSKIDNYRLALDTNEQSQEPSKVDSVVEAVVGFGNEKFDIEEVIGNTNRISSKLEDSIIDKEATVDVRGRTVKNGQLMDFMDKINNALSDIARQGFLSLSEMDAYDLLSTIKNMQMGMEDFVWESDKQLDSLLLSVEEVCSKYKKIAIEMEEFSNDENKMNQQLEIEDEQDIMDFETERADVMERLRNGQLQSKIVNGKEYFIIRDPEIDPETQKIVKRGVICSALALVDRYVNLNDEKEVVQVVGDNMETYITLEEARETGFAPRSRREKNREEKAEENSINDMFL